MTTGPDPFSDLDETLPPALLADLRRSSPTPAVPSAVDRAIRQQGWAYFAGQRRVRRWVRVGGAAAAAAVVGIGLWLTTGNHPQGPSVAQSFQAEDIDHNGVVDIRDAFTVARGLRDHTTNPKWDVTGDGVVDQADVDQIANAAVATRGGAR